MPFIQTLGYDVFNPSEVVPEYVCDIGTKKGEKIDYAIFRDEEPIILIECKHWKQKLDIHDGQLLRYFHVSKAKFSILTNGISYRFYTDLVEANKMDEKPFLEFNIDEIKETQVEKLKEFHKTYFNPENICTSAFELKTTSILRQLVYNELHDPSDDFVRYFAKQAHDSIVNSKIIDFYRPLVKRTFTNLMNETLNDRLKSAITTEEEKSNQPTSVEEELLVIQPNSGKEIVTTEEELEGFYIIKSILRPHIRI
jgi:hypothetical protein